MYHRVLLQAPSFSRFNLQVTQEDLERQILFLKSRGFEAVTFQDLAARRLPRKPVLLTFDDGYEDNYRFLFPLLQKHRMKAVIYILGDRKHKNNFWDIPQGEAEAALLSPAQITEMQKSGWVEFGSHSMNHRHLTQVSPKDLDREVEGCKKSLENFLQKPVLSFAYPYGELNDRVKKRTAEAGYSFGVAVNSGPTRFGEDLMEIRRVHMFPKTSTFEYFKKTSGWYLRYRRFRGKN
jgi:peptidoglycan/xylan/chitin deacetylase (PgdA/CDA1 family)